MGTSLLWIAGIALESVILFRFLKHRLYAHYPFFFAYLAVVWSSEITLWPVYRYHFASYSRLFWADQFLTLLAGFGVLFEIVRKSFQRYPGARTFATTVVAAMFAILCGYFVFRLLPSAAFTLRRFFGPGAGLPCDSSAHSMWSSCRHFLLSNRGGKKSARDHSRTRIVRGEHDLEP